MGTERPGLTYRDAGVDIDVATGALDRIRQHAHSTFGAEAAPIGHFGGVYRLPAGGDRLLVASADGVGTKLKIAFVTGGDAHWRVGGDLVNHCVNDLLACGAMPLFFLDYIAMGKLDPVVLEQLVGGMAESCRANGMALIGGETAEMPGLYADGEYDAAGFIVGEVAPERAIDGSRVSAGNVVLGLPSVGLHTNGYSLARRIAGLSGEAGHDRPILDAPLPGGDGMSLGEALLQPHPSYLPTVRPLLEIGIVNGMAHITGGGLVDNLPRALPDGLAADLDPASWPVPPLLDWLVAEGNVAPEERYRAFNMGVGFVVIVDAGREVQAQSLMPGAIRIGSIIEAGTGSPQVTGLWQGDSGGG